MAGKFQISQAGKSFEVELSDDGVLVDSKEHSYDLAKVSGSAYHLILGSKSYNIDVVELDKESKKIVLKVNGTRYQYDVKDQYDLLLENLGMDQVGGGKLSELKAPMPGLVVDLVVEPGATVQEGDALIILEAMKMENVLKAPGEGVVKSLQVKKGDTVDKNELLITFE